MAVIVAMVLLQGLDTDVRSYVRYQVNMLTTTIATPKALPEAAVLEAALLDAGVLDSAPILASPGKNLVLIYLEGLEATYLDQSLFGNVLPALNSTQQEAIAFTNMIQTAGTGYTIAGIVASQCGTPMLFNATSTDPNDFLYNGFLNQATCLGDILNAAGYQQVFVGGASLEFSGKGQFLESHQYNRVLGRKALLARLDDANYHTGWGLYDDSLFDIARDEFTRLAAGQEPFNLTLLTIDTHSPGKPSASCLPFSEADNSILDAVYCTDQLLSGFLAFLKASPAWPNTVVALVSDHYAMRNAAQEYFPPNRDRRLLFNLLNAGDSREVQSAGTLMDIGPTVLEAIDVQHNQAFLAGQNLLNMPAELTMEQLTDTNREALIQQINSSLFTMRSKDLCEQPALLTINDGTLSVGGKNIPLSIYGSRVPVTALGSTYSLLVFWDADGSLKTTLLVPNNQLNRTLFQYREARLLVVAPNKLLPETLRRRSLATQADTLVAVMGNLRGEMVHLDLQNVDGQLQVSNSECTNLMNIVNASVNSIDELTFVKQYCPNTDNGSNHYDTESGLLQLGKVRYKGSLFSATLQVNSAGLMTPLSFERLKKDRVGYCYAYINDDALVVPDITANQTQTSLRFERVSGAELQFLTN